MRPTERFFVWLSQHPTLECVAIAVANVVGLCSIVVAPMMLQRCG
jgi:hypothetical protein